MKKNITGSLFKNFIRNRARHLFLKSFLISLLGITNIATAGNHSDEKSSSAVSTAYSLGTPANFLNQVGLNDSTKASFKERSANSFTQSTLVEKQFNLIDNFGNNLKVVAENLSIEADGTLSMNGRAAGIPNSEFILQGTEDNVYGWVILKDQNVAYEYTTKNGQMTVDEINVTDVLPVCDFGDHDHGAVNQGIAYTELAEPYPGTHVGQLESKPGSSYVIFLDTRNIMSNGVPHDVSKEFVWTTWQIVAASLSMFDVNVTTNQSVYNNAAPSRRGGGTLYRETGRSSCAFAFGTSTFCTLYKETDAYGQGRTAAHEYGHLLHLRHDGGAPGGEYHQGIADYQWMPIMGNYWFANSWGQALYQWSKGEYSGASNREDDFSIMQNYLPLRADDIPGSKALVIDSNGNVSGESNKGQIARNTDTDSFTFTIGASGGHVNFNIDRSEHIGGAMLDVQAYIKNSSGAIVAQSNKSVNRSASFNRDLSAGNYTLEISGGAEGTPSHGFSKYSSLGYYTIEGSVTGGDSGGNTAPVANFTFSCDQATCQFDGSDSYDPDGSINSYQWDFGDGSTQGGEVVSHSFSQSGSYNVRLTVTDNKNKTSSVVKVVSIDIVVGDIVLTNNVAVTGLSGNAGQEIFFKFSVPAGAKNLKFTTSGGSGDADLVVSFGSHPSKTTFDCKSEKSTNSELCQFATPQAGEYYAMYYGYSNFANASITASYETPDTGTVLTKNVAVNGLSGAANQEMLFSFTVPSQANNLTFTTSGGTGDADLVVSYGTPPTRDSYDCRSQNSNNNESCQFASPQTGVYYILFYGYSSFANASIVANYGTN